MVVKHVDVPYAKRRKVRRSADLYAVKQIPEEHLSAYFPSQKAVWYMRKRGFSRKTVERFNVGYDMYKNRVIIPIRDGRDKLVAFIGRTTLHKDQLRLKDERRAAAGKDPFPRYMIYDNVPRRFLMLNQSFAEKGGDAVIVVESSMDYLMLRQWGYDNVVCILGSHASNWQWSLLSKFKRIYAFLDNDAAGASGVQGLIKNAEQTDIVIHVPNYEEADGDVDEMTHSRFKFLLETSTPVSRWVKKIPLLA